MPETLFCYVLNWGVKSVTVNKLLYRTTETLLLDCNNKVYPAAFMLLNNRFSPYKSVSHNYKIKTLHCVIEVSYFVNLFKFIFSVWKLPERPAAVRWVTARTSYPKCVRWTEAVSWRSVKSPSKARTSHCSSPIEEHPSDKLSFIYITHTKAIQRASQRPNNPNI